MKPPATQRQKGRLPRWLSNNSQLRPDPKLKVEPGEVYSQDFRRLYSVQQKDAFREALGKS